MARPRAGDMDALVELAGDREVSRWTAFVPHPYTADDALAFIAGAGVNRRLMGRLERSFTSQGAREFAITSGITSADKLAVLEGKNGLAALKDTTELIREQIVARKALGLTAAPGSRLLYRIPDELWFCWVFSVGHTVSPVALRSRFMST